MHEFIKMFASGSLLARMVKVNVLTRCPLAHIIQVGNKEQTVATGRKRFLTKYTLNSEPKALTGVNTNKTLLKGAFNTNKTLLKVAQN